MNQFYESELSDITRGEGKDGEGHDTSREIINKKKGMNLTHEKRRREMKKDPLEKAKEVFNLSMSYLTLENMGKHHQGD
jgi:hypothetical protein